MQRTTVAVALFAAASFALALPSAAQQSYGAPPPGERGYARPGPPSRASIEQNLSSLRNRLALDAEQEPAWQAFSDAMRQQAEQVQADTSRLSAQPAPTAPERFAQMSQAMQQGAASMDAVAQALSALYAVLTPGQRTIIENEFPARPGRRGPGVPGGIPPPR